MKTKSNKIQCISLFAGGGGTVLDKQCISNFNSQNLWEAYFGVSSIVTIVDHYNMCCLRRIKGRGTADINILTKMVHYNTLTWPQKGGNFKNFSGEYAPKPPCKGPLSPVSISTPLL